VVSESASNEILGNAIEVLEAPKIALLSASDLLAKHLDSLIFLYLCSEHSHQSVLSFVHYKWRELDHQLDIIFRKR
jgi:hypothetical protein